MPHLALLCASLTLLACAAPPAMQRCIKPALPVLSARACPQMPYTDLSCPTRPVSHVGSIAADDAGLCDAAAASTMLEGLCILTGTPES